MSLRASAGFTFSITLVAFGCLLSYLSVIQSPSVNELAHLVAGISNWKTWRFELFMVNPPLVRVVSAAPALCFESALYFPDEEFDPIWRPEVKLSREFLRGNGNRACGMLVVGRLACIPFGVLGGMVCYKWARETFGDLAGILALIVWCFSPSVLGHGSLITPDVPAAAIGAAAMYLYWRWLRQPAWGAAALAALLLGLALLTKMTWILLLGLWPALWQFWWITRPSIDSRDWRREGIQLGAMLLGAFYVLNLGYGYEGSFHRLGNYTFVSRLFTGREDGLPGNRFAGTIFASLPVPVPRNYLQGIDLQRKEFESGRLSYLRGEIRDRGWWYYYLYAAAVKVPLGVWCLLALTIVFWFMEWRRSDRDRLASGKADGNANVASAGHEEGGRLRITWRDEVVLLAPAVAVFLLASSQTGYTVHFRYVLPAAPFLCVFVSQAAPLALKLGRLPTALVAASISWFLLSSLSVYPHSLSYFNELAGGPRNGPKHLLGSNVDWGQDLWYLRDWTEEHPEARPFFLAYCGGFEPKDVGVDFPPVPRLLGPKKENRNQDVLVPGWYAASVNYVYGYEVPEGAYAWLRTLKPVALAGYSIYIYRVTADDLERLQKDRNIEDK